MAGYSDILMLMPQTRALKAADTLKGAALSYPGLTEAFHYPVSYAKYGTGVPQDGASAAYDLAQTLDEHNAAVQMGIEEALESWWPETDSQPRGGNAPVSTAVSDVMIMPDNSIAIQYGNRGPYYTVKHTLDPRMASEAVASLFTDPAGIGRAVSNGTKRHYAPGDEGVPDVSVGGWKRSL